MDDGEREGAQNMDPKGKVLSSRFSDGVYERVPRETFALLLGWFNGVREYDRREVILFGVGKGEVV